MFQQELNAVGGSLTLSAIVAAIPLLTLFVLLGALRMKAWQAGLISLALTIVLAVLAFSMPVGQTLLATTQGAAFGFFPILWIVINAIWVYNLTVATGHFDVLRRSFESVSSDQRIQAIIIAFCFGALLEALAGFGTPVAITVVMLMALGFAPLKAAVVALIANTAPVAFGALATPITTLAVVSSGASDDARLTTETIGSMVGRQTPILAVFVPLVLVLVVDGKRGVKQTWLPALTCGVTFAIAQFVASNFISVPLADIVAAMVGAAAVVLLTRVWTPSQVLTAADAEAEELARTDSTSTAGGGGATTTTATATVTGKDTARGTGKDGGGEPGHGDAPAEVVKAYLPYAVIIAIFAIVNIPAVKDFLAEAPWTTAFAWPGLDVLNTAGDPVSTTTFTFNWLPAAGTLMIIAGLITMVVLKISPAEGLRIYGKTYVDLATAIVTVMAVLALAYVLNLSGMTTSLGAWLAQTGSAFAIISPILGWIGVAVSGSDTSANALFGALQVQTAGRAGLDPLLMAAANSSGGVLGKMVSPQNLAIAAAAAGMAGKEGDIFRKVIGWSLLLLAFMCVLVALQSTPVLDWMIPSS